MMIAAALCFTVFCAAAVPSLLLRAVTRGGGDRAQKWLDLIAAIAMTGVAVIQLRDGDTALGALNALSAALWWWRWWRGDGGDDFRRRKRHLTEAIREIAGRLVVSPGPELPHERELMALVSYAGWWAVPPGLLNQDPITEVWMDSARWRAQLDERRRLVPALPPGSPHRLLLHLRRIAATGTVDAADLTSQTENAS